MLQIDAYIRRLSMNAKKTKELLTEIVNLQQETAKRQFEALKRNDQKEAEYLTGKLEGLYQILMLFKYYSYTKSKQD